MVLMHQDLDHLGNVPALLATAPGRVEVLAGAGDVPVIEGEQPSPCFTPEVIPRMMEALPVDYTEEQREAFARRWSTRRRRRGRHAGGWRGIAVLRRCHRHHHSGPYAGASAPVPSTETNLDRWRRIGAGRWPIATT